MSVFSPFLGNNLKWHCVHTILILCRHNGMFFGVLTPVSITSHQNSNWLILCAFAASNWCWDLFYPSLHLVSHVHLSFFSWFPWLTITVDVFACGPVHRDISFFSRRALEESHPSILKTCIRCFKFSWQSAEIAVNFPTCWRCWKHLYSVPGLVVFVHRGLRWSSVFIYRQLSTETPDGGERAASRAQFH